MGFIVRFNILVIPIIFALLGIYKFVTKNGKFPFDQIILIVSSFLIDKPVNINLGFLIIENYPFPQLIPCIVYLFLNRKQLDRYFIHKTINLKSLIVGLFSGVIFAMLVFYQTKGFRIGFNIIFSLVLVIVAIGEELLFRGIFLGELIKSRIHPSISLLIVSCLFAMGHIRVIERGNILAFVTITIMGLFSGILLIKSKNIYASLALHVTNNFIVSLSRLV